jgi:hypothetical protein
MTNKIGSLSFKINRQYTGAISLRRAAVDRIASGTLLTIQGRSTKVSSDPSVSRCPSPCPKKVILSPVLSTTTKKTVDVLVFQLFSGGAVLRSKSAIHWLMLFTRFAHSLATNIGT